MDKITGIIIDDILYKPVLNKTEYTCEECHLREFCENSQDHTFALFCAVYIDRNHHFESIKNSLIKLK